MTIKHSFDMIYGLVASSSCLLSEIARSLNEDITLKAVEKRLSRKCKKTNKISDELILKLEIEYILKLM